MFLVAVLFVAGGPCGVGGAGVSLARAAVETYAIDAGHSNVGFSIRHFFSRVPGRFTGIEGTITFDQDDPAAGTVQVVIDAASIDTGDADRDTHLRSVDFFDVVHHPRITFVSSRVRPDGETRMTVEGTLTLRGVSRPVTLEVEFLGSGMDLWGGHRSGFEARATIDRKEFGMIWNRVLDGGGVMLGDEVSVLINIEGLRQDAAAAEGPPEGDGPAEGEPPAGGEPAESTPVEEESDDPPGAEPAQQ